MVLGPNVGEWATECFERYRHLDRWGVGPAFWTAPSRPQTFQTRRGVGAGWYLREGYDNTITQGPSQQSGKHALIHLLKNSNSYSLKNHTHWKLAGWLPSNTTTAILVHISKLQSPCNSYCVICLKQMFYLFFFSNKIKNLKWKQSVLAFQHPLTGAMWGASDMRTMQQRKAQERQGISCNLSTFIVSAMNLKVPCYCPFL